MFSALLMEVWKLALLLRPCSVAPEGGKCVCTAQVKVFLRNGAATPSPFALSGEMATAPPPNKRLQSGEPGSQPKGGSRLRWVLKTHADLSTSKFREQTNIRRLGFDACGKQTQPIVFTGSETQTLGLHKVPQSFSPAS